MKVCTTKHPFDKVEDKENIYIVLTEDETKWIHNKKNICHGFLKNVIADKVKKTQKRYKKPITVFDKNGKLIKRWKYSE